MLLSNLIIQLQSVLPLFDDRFTTNNPIAGISKTGSDVTVNSVRHSVNVGENVILSGVQTNIELTSISNDLSTIASVTQLNGTATVETISPHYLKNRDEVTISGADQFEYNSTVIIKLIDDTKFSYRVNTATVSPATGGIVGQINNVAIAISAVDNDLTEGFNKIISISSTEALYNGKFELDGIPTRSRTIFRFKMTGIATASTGTLKTFHNLGFNGVQVVSAVLDSDNFQFISDDDRLSIGSGLNMQLKIRPRITGASDINRAIDSYTRKEDKQLWGFWVADATDANNERSDNDTVNGREVGQDIQTRMIDNPNFYIFIPTQDDLSGRAAFDLAQEIAVTLYKSIFGYRANSLFALDQKDLFMPVSHGAETIDNGHAFMVYRYSFQYSEYLYSCSKNQDPDVFMSGTGDTLPELNTRAFREINSKFLNDQNVIIKNDEYDV